MAEFNITADDLDRMARMAYLESGSIPVGDRVRDFQQVLGSMLTRGQLFANGMAGQGYGGLRSDQGGNTGYANTAIQRSLAAGNAYEPLTKFGNDLSKLPEAPQIYRELAAKYFADVLRDPDVVNLHTDYGNPVVVKDRQGANWENHWLYGVSQNPDMVNGAGTPNQHAHGTMTGIKLPSSFNPGFDGGAQDWINRNKSIDGLTTDDAIQRMLDWANTPDVNFPSPGSDGFGDGLTAGGGAPGVVSNYGTPYETGGAGYGFSGSDVSSGVGPGFNNLGGAVPFGNVNPLSFASGRNFAGGVGLGSLNPSLASYGPAPTDYGFAGGFNPSQGVGAGVVGQLPAGFDSAAYLAQNPDVAAAGMDAAHHYLNFGAQEGRALAPPGWTQTQNPPAVTSTFGPSGTPTIGSGSTASTIGAPAVSDALPPFFSPRDYVAANADLAGMSDQQAIDHFQNYGRYEARALAPWLQASVYAAPSGTPTQGPSTAAPTFGPTTTAQTIGPDGGVSVMPPGLTPTQEPSALTPTQGPGPTITARTGTFNGDQYLQANADVAAARMDPLQHFLNYGYREGRAIDTLGTHFNGQAYLAANQDVAMANLDPLAHFLRYGSTEARTLAPTDWASPLTATTEVTPQGTSWLASTYGPGQTANTYGIPGLTSTYGAPDPTQTIGPPALTGTYGPPATTPTLNTAVTTPSWNPFGGAGIGNPLAFSGANVGGGLGAMPQTFGSYYPVGTGGPAQEPAPSGPDMSNPFGFTSMDASGFDPNALGGGGGGGSVDLSFGSGFDEAGAMRNVLAQQAEALRRADQAAKTPMHTDPNAFNAVLANGGNAVGFGTPLQNPGAVQAPVVPNLTLANFAMGQPGGMFAAFAPWR